VAHAVAANLEALARKKWGASAAPGLEATPVSRLALWWAGRLALGEQEENVGCHPRDVLDYANGGVPFEARWRYDPTLAYEQPPAAVTGEPRSTAYVALSGLDDVKACLGGGYPCILAFDVYQEAMRNDGNVQPPGPGMTLLGTHEVLIVGYDDALGQGAVRFFNSWGSAWGQGGFGWLPYAYFSGHVYDQWSVRDEDDAEFHAAVQGFIAQENARLAANQQALQQEQQAILENQGVIEKTQQQLDAERGK
jgi:hypothetical protein